MKAAAPNTIIGKSTAIKGPRLPLVANTVVTFIKIKQVFLFLRFRVKQMPRLFFVTRF